jgi:hypothetical protein
MCLFVGWFELKYARIYAFRKLRFIMLQFLVPILILVLVVPLSLLEQLAVVHKHAAVHFLPEGVLQACFSSSSLLYCITAAATCPSLCLLFLVYIA